MESTNTQANKIINNIANGGVYASNIENIEYADVYAIVKDYCENRHVYEKDGLVSEFSEAAWSHYEQDGEEPEDYGYYRFTLPEKTFEDETTSLEVSIKEALYEAEKGFYLDEDLEGVHFVDACDIDAICDFVNRMHHTTNEWGALNINSFLTYRYEDDNAELELILALENTLPSLMPDDIEWGVEYSDDYIFVYNRRVYDFDEFGRLVNTLVVDKSREDYVVFNPQKGR